MALKPAEITRLQQMSDEMAKLIEDIDTTSSEAMVVYGKIGRACARALSTVAASAAKQAEREKHVQKFQTARQTRQQKKSSTQAQPTQSATRPGTATSPSA